MLEKHLSSENSKVEKILHKAYLLWAFSKINTASGSQYAVNITISLK